MICPASFASGLLIERTRPVSRQTTTSSEAPPAKAEKVTSKAQELPKASVPSTVPAPSRPGSVGSTRQVAVATGVATVPQPAGNGAAHVRCTFVALRSVTLATPVSNGAESVEVPSNPSTPPMIDFSAVQTGGLASPETQIMSSAPKFLNPCWPLLDFVAVNVTRVIPVLDLKPRKPG